MNLNQLKYLKQVIQKEVDEGALAGAAIRVIHENKTMYDESLGYADREKGLPITGDTIYRIFSMTKPITAAAAMILFERGQLQLLAPVSDYLEGFRNQKVWTDQGLVDTVREVTIQDLLNMTSGVPYPDEATPVGRLMGELFDQVDQGVKNGEPVSTIDFCNRIGKLPLEFQPGEKWLYGASADILGAVIEKIAGMKLSEFLQKELFEPLGMKDTAFYVPEEKLNRLAVNYQYNPVNGELEVFKGRFLCVGDCSLPPAFESAGAGLFSTVEDYSRFALMLANGGSFNGVRILGHKTVEYMATPQLTEDQAVTYNWDSQYGYSYGNLLRSLVDPARGVTNGSVGEYGWDGWTGNYFFVDPKEKLLMIYMVQKCGSGPDMVVIRKLRQIIYSSL